MKTPIKHFTIGLFFFLSIISCVQDDEFVIAPLEINDLNIENAIVLTKAREQWQQEFNSAIEAAGLNPNDVNDEDAITALKENTKFTFDNGSEDETFAKAYVISSDQTGNFFEELFVQDSSVNPEFGVRILIDESPLYTSYELGREVFIKLNGLTLGLENGVFTLGILAGGEIESIPAFSREEFVQRGINTPELIPLEISVSDFSDDFTNLYIKTNSLQFEKSQVLEDSRLSFASERFDEFDGERVLESCDTGETVILSTSTFSDFKALLLPEGRGSFTGILTKNFFGDEFNLVLNDPLDLKFDNPERCDAPELSCGLAESSGNTVLFSDDFEGQQTNTEISGNGWTNYIQEGTRIWEAFSSDGANGSLGISATVGSFRSGDDSSVAWLITPAIDLDTHQNVTLEFQTSNSFADDSNLEVLFSKDWDGTPENIANATWVVIADAFVVQDSNDFSEWFSSGIVDLSCETGKGYIAFKYTGNGDEDADGAYELDEIRISSN